MKKNTNTSIAASTTGGLEIIKTKEFRNTRLKPTQFTTKLTAFSAVLVATTSLASAASLVEYFNGYGTSTVVLNGLGSTSGGWAGPWGGSALPDYKANTNLSYTATGYSGSGNGTTSSDGASGLGATGGDNDIATRTFSTGLTGTVWVSTLAFLGNSNPKKENGRDR